MNEREARDVVQMIEASFAFDLGEVGRNVWITGLATYDNGVGLEAAVMLCRTTSRRPTLKDLIDGIRKLQADRREMYHDDHPGEPPPDWVKGWAISRYRDHDMRLWPEQQAGYRVLDIPWDRNLMMPDDDRERYTVEGNSLPLPEFWKLLRGTTSAVA